MTNPTSNFGWQMPEPTDLVTNLPADFEVFGQAVDTDFADLLGGTTGQVLSKTSATDLDFTWIANDQGDITAVTVTSPITGGGSSGSVGIAIQDGTTAQKGAVQLENSTSSTSTTTAAVPANVKTSYDLAAAAVPKSTVTTNGDLIYGTGSAAVTRLGIGSTSQVLTVAGGVPTWATPAASGAKIVQVVYGSTSTGASSSSSTYADTNLSANITPTSASNDIYVFVSQTGIVKSNANAANGLNLKLFRDAVDINFFGRNILYTGTAIQLIGSTASIVYKDSPATTSLRTYKTKFANENNTGTVYVNDSGAVSTIVLMEVTP